MFGNRNPDYRLCCGVAINSLYLDYLLGGFQNIKLHHAKNMQMMDMTSPFSQMHLLGALPLPFWFWPIFIDINERLGTQPAKNMESHHYRSKLLEEADWSLIISLLLLNSNALNKIKENRAYLVIPSLDLQPTGKSISKKTNWLMFSLSEFKLQNFWARLSDNLFIGWQGQALVCLEEKLGFLCVATGRSDRQSHWILSQAWCTLREDL